MTASGSADPPASNFRLFIAILVPEKIKAEMAEAQLRFRSALPGSDISWTKREQFHLTLRFLGNVAEVRVQALKNAVHAACWPAAGLQLRAGGIGFFPERGEPRVVWAGVREASGRLGLLHQDIARATQGFGQPEREQTFTGHVTLARVKRIKLPESETLRRVAMSLAKQDFGCWTAEKIEIMRSDLTPDGARHESLASVRFGE